MIKQPRFSLNEFVVIYDGDDVEEVLRGTKCQVKDYNRDNDEYQIFIVEGQFKNKSLWAPAKYLWSWEHYRLVRTIDKDRYQEYLHQMEYAIKTRDYIFKQIYGLIQPPIPLSVFKSGARVRVKRHAKRSNPWDNWSPEMDNIQGERCIVLGVDRKYNSQTSEYEDVVKVEFTAKELFSDYTYSYYFLPIHLELED